MSLLKSFQNSSCLVLRLEVQCWQLRYFKLHLGIVMVMGPQWGLFSLMSEWSCCLYSLPMVGAWPNYPVCHCKILGGTIPSSDFAVLIDCLSVDVMWWSASDCCSDESRPESKIGRRMACRGHWWSYVVSLVRRSRVRTTYVPTLVSPSPFGTVGR